MNGLNLLGAIGFTVGGVGSFLAFLKTGWESFLLTAIVFGITGVIFSVLAYNDIN